jgi:hypothetical protein
MPLAIKEWLMPWLQANYQPEVRRKHRRNEQFWNEGRDPHRDQYARNSQARDSQPRDSQAQDPRPRAPVPVKDSTR